MDNTGIHKTTNGACCLAANRQNDNTYTLNLVASCMIMIHLDPPKSQPQYCFYWKVIYSEISLFFYPHLADPINTVQAELCNDVWHMN